MNLENSNLKNKKVILRTDYNVPIINKNIQSTKRIDSTINTIQFILDQEPKQLIIISHLGRPKGIEYSLSLEPIRKYLSNVLKHEITLYSIEDLPKQDSIILLENIRFYPEETEMLDTTLNFRNKLSQLCDVYINDAFGCSHRPHSSIIGINAQQKYMGFLLEKEIKYLKDSLKNNGIKSLILGGSKVGDKIKLIKNLIPKTDNIIIGGGMAFTFLKYMGFKTGNSLVDNENLNSIQEILNYAKLNNTKIILPKDFKCNQTFSNNGNIKTFLIEDGIPENYMGLDIGKESIDLFKKYIQKSDIIIWNGPLGVFEFDNFSEGSKQILNYLANLDNTIKIIGGGDIVSCCEKFNYTSKMSHVSTGGGASLELLEGKILPGIEFLNNSKL